MIKKIDRMLNKILFFVCLLIQGHISNQCPQRQGKGGFQGGRGGFNKGGSGGGFNKGGFNKGGFNKGGGGGGFNKFNKDSAPQAAGKVTKFDE